VWLLRTFSREKGLETEEYLDSVEGISVVSIRYSKNIFHSFKGYLFCLKNISKFLAKVPGWCAAAHYSCFKLPTPELS